ncbi:MAG TPA: YdeI/OmpD-associated family protein, partial [Candidatus Saccharimonadales bacterium]|nr:YdeI/OmpD-associated family protein [Candidatus Saccharimonadales bacterium]
MAKEKIAGGVAHQLPTDLRKALLSSAKALAAWENITPLARNEWICWTITVKTAATRKNHIERTVSELTEGVRRPCCWMGCIHRTDKAMS